MVIIWYNYRLLFDHKPSSFQHLQNKGAAGLE